MHIVLPSENKKLERYKLIDKNSDHQAVTLTSCSRVVYAAAHVVIDPLTSHDPWSSSPSVDWDGTLAYREYLWSMGFKVAEAMDTSQRGMGLDWPTALELSQRSLALAATIEGADLACGAGTDHLADNQTYSMDDIRGAYIEHIEAIEAAGGDIILMASRGLAKVAKNADDYIALYSSLLQGCQSPVILHWLGDMFDPHLEGYWGSDDVWQNMQTVLQIINENKEKVAGIKISLLHTEYEIALRNQLPDSVKMFTGDDFNYSQLIEGDTNGYSHALLGIFDPIAPVAVTALNLLGQGDIVGYRARMEPTVALSRQIFSTPTAYYKAGVVFLAWLNGHQSHFAMAAGMQSARSILHYADVFRLADKAGVLTQPELALQRMTSLLALNGIAAK